VFIHKDLVSPAEIKYWKERNLDVIVWTVNDESTKAYLRSLNIPYITDDCTC